MSDTTNYVFEGFDDGFATVQGWDGEGAGPPEIPVGEYAFELTGLEIKPNKKGNGQNFVCDWEVIEGDYAGKKCKTWMVCAGESFKDGHKKRIAAVFRDALGLMRDGKMTPGGKFATQDAVGRRLIATVTWEESKDEKYDGEQLVTKTYLNIKLSCERPYEEAAGETVNNQQAAAPPPPAAPKGPPPPAPSRRPPPAPPARPPAGGRAA